MNDFDKWDNLTNETHQCQYVKTGVARRKKDVIAAGADSDQEEWIEEAFNQNNQKKEQIYLLIKPLNPQIFLPSVNYLLFLKMVDMLKKEKWFLENLLKGNFRRS